MRLCRIAILILVGLILVLMSGVFSPKVIIPPANPIAPVTVYVVEHSIHSRLVLPDRNGELIQYAYGDWNYFALNQQDWGDTLAALLIPTQGALGRRKFSNVDQLRQTSDHEDSTILSFEVAGANVINLLKSLNERFNRNINTSVENPLTQLTLVKDNQDYTLLYNSNHQLVRWLKDLECRVEGFVMLPNFKVK